MAVSENAMGKKDVWPKLSCLRSPLGEKYYRRAEKHNNPDSLVKVRRIQGLEPDRQGSVQECDPLKRRWGGLRLPTRGFSTAANAQDPMVRQTAIRENKIPEQPFML